MIIGAMNHPKCDPVSEMEWMHQAGLGFIDLTLEPPMASSDTVDPHGLRAALERNELKVIGHTAFYLPIASPIEVLRAAAITELRRCIDCFAAIGAHWMNVHPDPDMHFHSRADTEEQNRRSLGELLRHAEERGIGVMVENVPRGFNSVEELAPLLDELPQLGLHLDIGHANLRVEKSTAQSLIERYGNRIRHVHLHDNKGGTADLHLPLGAGTLKTCDALSALKATGYDQTITLEVFCAEPYFFLHSRDTLRAMWDGL